MLFNYIDQCKKAQPNFNIIHYPYISLSIVKNQLNTLIGYYSFSCLYQGYSVLFVVWEAMAKFGPHVDNWKFNTQTEE